MTYHAIDVVRAHSFIQLLRVSARRVDPVQELIIQAEHQADLTVHAGLLLDQIWSDLVTTARAVETALAKVLGFEIGFTSWAPAASVGPPPSRTPVPQLPNVGQLVARTPPLISARWDAQEATRWNNVHQEASHNSYAVPGGIATLFDRGFRTFELDIHRGAPTDFTPPISLARSPVAAIVADHFDHRGGRPDDWRVYHVSGDARSEYDFLSEGLQVVAALDTSDPLTIFVDNKDAFGGTHTSDALDALVRGTFGERLFTPMQLQERGTGWPTVAELQNRVIVVLTDQVDGYGGTQVFTASPSPNVIEDPGVGFVNVDARFVSVDEVAATQRTSQVVRTYSNPDCPPATIEETQRHVGIPNYRAIDADETPVDCGAPVPRPPEGTPVPVSR